MRLEAWIGQWSRGWRGPAAAAFVAFLAGLPGLIAMPPLDRDEARFAQATAQMLERDDFVMIRFQDQPRFKKPVGIHWLQAASVRLLSDPEARQIWAYRIPSLLGAMLAAAACAWGAAAFFGAETGLIAGALLGASFLLSTEAFIAKTDAALAGATTLAMAALGRIYAGARGGPAAPPSAVWIFWGALAAAMLIKGPVALMVAALAIAVLAAWDRRPGWLARLNWYWGLIVVAAVVGPWAGAVTVATDGGFWSQAVNSDLAPKLAGGQETHGAPPGYHALLTPILAFPITLLLPAALVLVWKRRAEPGVRFAAAWVIPTWLVFEMLPTKLPHYLLPAYGGLAWLAARSLAEPLSRAVRWTGAGLAALVSLALAAGAFVLLRQYGEGSDAFATVLTAALLAGAGLAGAWFMLRNAPLTAVAGALGLGALGHAALAAGLAPRLEPLWLSDRTEQAMAKAQLLPRQGVAEAPVAVAGYAEPSLVFALGTETELGGGGLAADAIAEDRPAVVEARQEPAFRQALKARGIVPRELAQIAGQDYSNGEQMRLRVYVAPDWQAKEPAP